MGRVVLEGVRLRAGDRTLLDDVSIDARPGELVAIVGPNGVGKTTLLRAIAGDARPAAGRIRIDGADVASLAPAARARAVTMIGGDRETPHGITVRELVATGRFSYAPWWDWTPAEDDGTVDAALARVELGEVAERDVATLSSGERQRAWLALALAQSARTVLLDEPTSHLDPRHALEVSCVMRAIASDETTAFVVSHDLNEAASIADRIALLGEGRLLICAPPHDALDPELLERAYGVAFDRVTLGGAPRVIARGYRANESVATTP